MKKHEWRETATDGSTVRFRATHFAGEWKFQTKAAEDEDWRVLDPPSVPALRALREKLFNKYQRRRLAWETVASVDKLIEEQAGEAVDPQPDSSPKAR